MLNPSVTDLVAAFEAAQRSQNAALKAAETAKKQAAAAIVAECKAVIDAIVAEFAGPFARAAAISPYHGMRHNLTKHSFDDMKRSYWSRRDNCIKLILSIAKDSDGLEFWAWEGSQYCMYSNNPIPPAIRTRDQTEFKVWLARFLGNFLANNEHSS